MRIILLLLLSINCFSQSDKIIIKRKVNAGVVSTPPSSSSYTLTSTRRTSAGVYKGDTLIRTLWSGTTQAAGNYTPTWDGKMDDLTTNAPSGNYTIRVASNSLAAQWEGIIGNTSDSITGESVWRGYNIFQDMCISGDYAYSGTDFNEREASVRAFALSNPQHKIDIMPHTHVYQSTNRVCTDGVNLYMGGINSQNEVESYVEGRPIGDWYNMLPFQGASVSTFGEIYKACNIVAGSARVSGMAVQKTGVNLFVARKLNNTIHVIHKTTGVIRQTLTFTAPTLLAIGADDNLWVSYNNGTVEKFTVNASTGALTSAGITISLTNVRGMCVSPDGSTIAIADAATYHQVKGYSTTTGTLSWTLGRAESYSTAATVYNDKFYFYDAKEATDAFTYVAYQPDGSLWIGDKGNYRNQKFNSSRVFVTTLSYLRGFYSSNVDVTNPTRVFADYLEYQINYAASLGVSNGSWTLVRNWGYNVPANREHNFLRLFKLQTFNNGRTYALQNVDDIADKLEWVELVNGGALRFTGVLVKKFDQAQLYPDETIRMADYLPFPNNDKFAWTKKSVTFDGSNNPVLGSTVEYARITLNPANANLDGPHVNSGEVTPNGYVISFKGNLETGYHLGAIPINGTGFIWQTAKTVATNTQGGYPANGEYDIGDRATSNPEFGGSVALALEDFVLWGYNGEKYNTGQTNIWNMVSNNGLFLNQFGTISEQVIYPPPQAKAEMAGNAFAPSIVKIGSSYYLYLNDESYHGGIHRWKITGLNTIQEHVIPITK